MVDAEFFGDAFAAAVGRPLDPFEHIPRRDGVGVGSAAVADHDQRLQPGGCLLGLGHLLQMALLLVASLFGVVLAEKAGQRRAGRADGLEFQQVERRGAVEYKVAEIALREPDALGPAAAVVADGAVPQASGGTLAWKSRSKRLPSFISFVASSLAMRRRAAPAVGSG